jgi:hypothetical protein
MADLLSLSQVLGRDPEALYHQKSKQAAPPGFPVRARLISNISTHSLRRFNEV